MFGRELHTDARYVSERLYFVDQDIFVKTAYHNTSDLPC